jgi:chemotaxis protein histidine kinase CheA
VRLVLRLAELTDRQPNGAARLSLLRDLFVFARDGLVLDFAADATGEYSVRAVVTQKMVEADQLAKAQAAGKAEPAEEADGPVTLDALRALMDPPQEDEKPAEGAETPPADEAATPPPKPRKRAAKKAPAAKKAAPRPAAAKKAAAPAKASPAKKAAPSARPADPAARPVDRPPARPVDRLEVVETAPDPEDAKRRLPCGCLVDDVIFTGKHDGACADHQ